MIIGVDMGASAVKICALEGNEVAFTHYEHGRGGDMPALLERLGLDAAGAELIALTGLSAKNSGLERLGAPVKYIPEPEAIGEGACWLTGRGDLIVASIGTGTAFVHAKGGVYTHLCGTGRRRRHAQGPRRQGARRARHAPLRPHGHGRRLRQGGPPHRATLSRATAYSSPEITASNLARLDPMATDAALAAASRSWCWRSAVR